MQSHSKHPKSNHLTFFTFAALTLLVFFGAITLAKGSKKYERNVYSKSFSSYFTSTIITGIESYNVKSALRNKMWKRRSNARKKHEAKTLFTDRQQIFPNNSWLRYFRHNTRSRLEFKLIWQFANPLALTSLFRTKSLLLRLFGGRSLLLFALSLCHVCTVK